MQNLNILIAGLGSIGVRHLENLKRLGCRHISIYRERNRNPYKEIDLQGIKIFNSYEKALEQCFDIVLICNPTAYHLNFAIPAAKAGIHLYIEKPLSHNMDNVDELLLWVKRNGLKVTVGYQLRFHPNLLAIRQWITSGKIGKLIAAHAEIGEYLPNYHPWEDYREGYAACRKLGGGVVLTQIHEIDYLLWLMGPLQVLHALGGNSGALEVDVEDHADCLMMTKDRSPVFLHMDYLQDPPCRTLKLIGRQGVITWDYQVGTAKLWKNGKVELVSEIPDGWVRNVMFVESLRDCLNNLHASEQYGATLAEGISSLETALDVKALIETNPFARE